MPAVEALGLRTPTLVTNLPVLREVTLNGANYIDNPHDEHEIADRMCDILRLGDAAIPSAALSHEIHQRFAPATVAKQYLSTLLNGSP